MSIHPNWILVAIVLALLSLVLAQKKLRRVHCSGALCASSFVRINQEYCASKDTYVYEGGSAISLPPVPDLEVATPIPDESFFRDTGKAILSGDRGWLMSEGNDASRLIGHALYAGACGVKPASGSGS